MATPRSHGPPPSSYATNEPEWPVRSFLFQGKGEATMKKYIVQLPAAERKACQ